MSDEKQPYRKVLVEGYKHAGPDFLAIRLTRIFSKIETEQDRVLHNDMIDDLIALLGDKKPEFLKPVAEEIINHPHQKNILLTIAKKIGQLSLFKKEKNA